MFARKTEAGADRQFKVIGATIAPPKTENLKDQWATIPSAPSMTTEEEKILVMLDERLNAAKDRHLKRIDVFNSSYLQFRAVNYYTKLYGAFPTYWNEWGAGVFIPRTFEVVEAARAQLKSREPDFTIDPDGRADSAYAKEANILMHGEYKRSYSHEEHVEALDDAVVFGAGIVRNDLIHDVEDQQVLSFDKDGNLKYTPGTKLAYYGVGSRRIDPYDFFPEPSPDATMVNGRPGKRDRGIRYAFVRTITDVEGLRAQYKKLYEKGTYGVTDRFQYLRPGGDLTDYKYLRTYIDDLYPVQKDIRYPATVSNIFGGATPQLQTDRAYSEGKIEVWEYFERDRYIVFAMGLILRDTPNPYPHKKLPFSKMTLFETKTFWSMGYPELMRWLQIIENTLYDQGLNNVVMNVHKMFAVNSRYLEDEGELVVRPFGIVHLKPIPGVSVNDAIQEVKFSSLMQDYFNFLTLSKQNISTLTGQSEFSTGGVTKEAKVERATVANRIAAGTVLRINQVARNFENQLISDSICQMLEIAQFYYQMSMGGEEGIDVEYTNGSKVDYYRYIPHNVEDLDPADIGKYSEGSGDGDYTGAITFDAIQGKYRVTVRGGSTISLDPDDEADLKLRFVDWAKTLVDPDKIVGTDAQGNPIGAPIFDVRKLSMEVAKDVFKIPNPEDLRYEQPEQQAAAAKATGKPVVGEPEAPPAITTPPKIPRVG